MTIKRSPIPPSITDPAELAFFDDLYRRQVAAVAQLGAAPTNAEIATAFNALIIAMQASKAMESS
jgi:hypothetical protein